MLYLTNTSELTAVADAIREKGETSAPLTYPFGFASAIADIQTGGGDADAILARTITTYTDDTVESVRQGAFRYCQDLISVSLPKCSSINAIAFGQCVRLAEIRLMSESVAALESSNAFGSTPIAGYSTVAGQYGSIYVPASLLTAYQAATNWTYFSSRFVGV